MVMPGPELKRAEPHPSRVPPPPESHPSACAQALVFGGGKSRSKESRSGVPSSLTDSVTMAASQTGHVPYRSVWIVTNGEDKDIPIPRARAPET